MTKTYKKYTEYKDSGIEWLGEIPNHWEVKPGFTIFKERNEKNIGLKNMTVLSLSYGNIIIKPEEKLTGLVPESFETYQIVYPGDIIIRPTDLQNDTTSLRTGFSRNNGIITSAYINLRVNKNSCRRFVYYILHTIDITKIIYGLGSGLRQNISFLDFKRFPFPLPPLSEQEKIAEFLDKKTADIDTAIAQKEQLIELLKERKQILINKAVTRGLNPDAELKDSGIDWIGSIPEHWEVRKLKYCADINKNSLNEYTNINFEFNYVDISSVSYELGITKTEQVSFKTAPSRARRLTENGDTILSTVRTYLKAIDYISMEKADCVFSTGFAVLHPLNIIHSKYLTLGVKSDFFTNQVDINSKGMSYPAINSTDLGNLLLITPPLSEQEEIVNYIEEHSAKIDKAIAQKQQEIEALKEYKATLIDSAVRGKICLV